MTESKQRMIDAGEAPTSSQIKSWLGKSAYDYWRHIIQMIDRKYPELFSPDWLYGGKKHGWALRYKKGKSFCTLIPEKNGLVIQIVFGAAERSAVEAIMDQLSEGTRQAYEKARTYHDGKWLFLKVDSDIVIDDIELLLEVKRRPVDKK
jgi:hypothetical protein